MATPPDRPRFAILASGRGSNAERLMEAFATDLDDAELVLVVSDSPSAAVLEKAERHGVPTAVVPRNGEREDHERALLATIGAAGVGHLLLAGYMRILSPWFLERFEGTILNIHPSLLPDFPGLDAQARQWEAGVEIAGATVHLVDEGIDSGPILLQDSIVVRGDEGPDGLADRILTEVEHRIYPQAVRMLIDRLSDPVPPVSRALFSVADKTGIADFAGRLARLDVTLLASGGTAAALEEAGLGVTRIEQVTGAGEMLGGRVKTLHPAVHAGILADRRNPEHMAELDASGYLPIDLVVCSLYPFEQVLASGAPRQAVIEEIDIGGPTLVRAAAKNADGGVTVVIDPADYDEVAEAIDATGAVPIDVRRRLAAKAWRHITEYDAAISAWSAGQAPRPLRYGENPHPEARLETDGTGRGVASGTLLQGKELSYNNMLDLDAAYRAVFGEGAHRCSVVKHTNPCGLAEAASQSEAFRQALSGDPEAAFGGVLGFNQPLEPATAEAIVESGLFVECIAAPGFDAAARDVLASSKNLRLLDMPPGNPNPSRLVHAVGGGVLIQDADPGPDPSTWKPVTRARIDDDQWAELEFAMRAVAILKSNAICVTRDLTLRGAGAGLMSRIDACRLALQKAGAEARGGVLASDGFFPFDDCVRLAADAGITAVVQPGGSKRDQEVIDACDDLGLAMVFTGRRHFRH
ncbi:MAG TPA: bifunctional phosphoribosylaminoimidazolecarboxamide formyltransferase/IMP cyclohydrolase [Acidimicrobiia bacterium]|nr:bifunctional phosphoribosylaminoimidazolecarboxamide formyltransferase/IMP cyclohydrolase [Acidimicrobiia bacterium]